MNLPYSSKLLASNCYRHLPPQRLELSQYDRCLSQYQQASVETDQLSATLNAGQAGVLAAGMLTASGGWLLLKLRCLYDHATPVAVVAVLD